MVRQLERREERDEATGTTIGVGRAWPYSYFYLPFKLYVILFFWYIYSFYYVCRHIIYLVYNKSYYVSKNTKMVYNL
jgi:hypothetical protein